MSGYGNYGSMPPGGAGAYGQPAASPPPNHLVWAILSTLLCCLPLGVVSIVFAAQVNSKWASGDYEGARQASASAKKWAIWSAILGVVGTLVVFGGLTAFDRPAMTTSP